MTDGGKTSAEEQANEHVKYFFLDLAAKGKDAWNSWCRANKDVHVTFAGVDFSEAPRDQIDFSGFDFGAGENLNFSGCKWRGVELPYTPNIFEPGLAFFTSAYFGRSANFTGATFGDGADFTSATFGGGANFTGATFGSRANFANVQILGRANFTGATFGDGADFTNTSFQDEAKFDKTHFEGSVASNSQTVYFRRAISFANARFDGEANFSDRRFEKTADFTNARFYYPPDFDGVENAGKIDFTGTHVGFIPATKWFHWTENSRMPVRLRAFRKIAEETKNHDLERDLYIEERKAERGVYLGQHFKALKEALEKTQINEALRIARRLVAHCAWIVIKFIYWALADYGRSFIRPVVWLALSAWLFHWGYAAILAPPISKAGPLDTAKYEQAARMVALGNAVPFVGPLTIDAEIKKLLFCPGFGKCSPENFQLLVIAQNVVSIILVFLSASPCAIISRSSSPGDWQTATSPLRARKLTAASSTKASQRRERAPVVGSLDASPRGRPFC